MSPGIPPSLDRQERQFTMVAGTVLIVAAFFIALYITVFRPMDEGAGNSLGDAHSGGRLEAYLAEEERASAYEALRNYMDQKGQEPGIDAVYCRDCTHQWRGDIIEFQGDVDFERPGGHLDPHTYVATLRGSEENGWEVLTVEIEPARR